MDERIKEVYRILDISENYLYLLDDTIRKIEDVVNQLNEQLKSSSNKLKSEEYSKILDEIFYYNNKNKSLIEQEVKIEDIINRCQEYLYWHKPPIKTDGIIDLRKKVQYGHNIKVKYEIYLHNEKTQVGNIVYRGYHTSHLFGDIEYDINKEFRGNNYAYRALCLLSDLLKENDVEDFWISAYNDNISSLKTIKKYGGKVIQNNCYTMYQSKTRTINKNTNAK